jgi:hypothetical protein
MKKKDKEHWDSSKTSMSELFQKPMGKCQKRCEMIEKGQRMIIKTKPDEN